jgi:TonB family protein
MRSVATIAVLALASVHSIADDDTSTITGSFVPAKWIDRVNPTYPYKSGFTDRGGWVRLAFCINTQGTVTDLVVLESSREGEFEQSALDAVSKWTYHPAVFREQPIRQCGEEVVLAFRPIHGTGARRIFAARLNDISALIEAKQLDEAVAQIEAMDTLNNYEEARQC